MEDGGGSWRLVKENGAGGFHVTQRCALSEVHHRCGTTQNQRLGKPHDDVTISLRTTRWVLMRPHAETVRVA